MWWFSIDTAVLGVTPANTRHWRNADLMLGQRRRRWTNIKSTLCQCLMFAGIGQCLWSMCQCLLTEIKPCRLYTCTIIITHSNYPCTPSLTISHMRTFICLVYSACHLSLRLTRVQLSCQLVFFIYLKSELLTQFPGKMMKRISIHEMTLIYYVNWSQAGICIKFSEKSH